MAGGAGNRNLDRSFYVAKLRPYRYRPCPSDFRERYLEMGWDAQWHYECGWKVMARWIDECGGDSLRAERAAYVKRRGSIRLHPHD